MWRRVLACWGLWIISHSIFADQLIIEPDMGRAPIIDAIRESKHSLTLTMYGMTDDILLDEFIKQKKRGRTTKIILEQAPYKAADENKKAITLLKENAVPWHGAVAPYRLIHQKTLVVDDKKAIVMTFNFTKSAFKRDRNFALIIDDKKKINAIQNLFVADWNQKSIIINQECLVISPDNSRAKILSLIKKAKQNIEIYSPSLSDYQLLGELAATAKRGVKIRILSSSTLRAKQKSFLTDAGITIAISKKYFIHAKVVIIDNKIAVLGSVNFTKPSFDANRELSIITEDKPIITTLLNTFKADWSQSDLATSSAKPSTQSTRTDKMDTNKKILLEALKIVNKILKN